MFTEGADYSRFMIDLWSCASKFTMADGSIVGGTDSDCETSFQNILDAIVDTQLYTWVFYNQPKFDYTEYGEDRIIKQTMMTEIRSM